MSDSDDDEFAPPVLHLRMLCLSHGANRIRAMPQKDGIVAVWEDSGTVKVLILALKLSSSSVLSTPFLAMLRHLDFQGSLLQFRA